VGEDESLNTPARQQLSYIVPKDECPIAKPERITLIDRPLTDVSVEVLIFVKLNRNTVEPLQIHLAHPGVDHEPVVGVD